MKTSTKLIVTAFVIFFISLGAYNFALRAEYLTGNYKKPFRDYITQNFKDFDEIEINAGSRAYVTITSGNDDVKLLKRSAQQIKITQQGKKLIVDMTYPNDDKFWYNTVLISCPKLVSVKVHSKFSMDGKIRSGNVPEDVEYYQELTIKGFIQDSLLIDQDNNVSVNLINNKLANLTAVTGTTANATPRLIIDKGNVITKGNFNIGQKSQLVISNVYIPQFRYHFSDSAKVSLTGIALRSLSNQ